MKIINNKLFFPQTNWICEVRENNCKIILTILKNSGYFWSTNEINENYNLIKEYKREKIWIVNNDNGKGYKILNIFFTEAFLEKELTYRKLIKL